jgi:hypothetical protein
MTGLPTLEREDGGVVAREADPFRAEPPRLATGAAIRSG